MSKINQILDLKNSSATQLSSMRESSYSARINSKMLAYGKDTSAMYNDIKDVYSKTMRTIENTVCTKKTILDFDNADYKNLYSSPLVYQRITAKIVAKYVNEVLVVNAILTNTDNHISWYKKCIGIEAKIIDGKDETSGHELLLGRQEELVVSQDSNRVRLAGLKLRIEDVDKYLKEELTDIAIYITPYIKIDDNYLYFYDNSVFLTCLRSGDAYYSTQH